jgi:putative tricarboxylic transport membrane protein
VELIIPVAPGGGTDQITRLLQGLIEQKGLSPVPFIPINRVGGAGDAAVSYVQQQEGDDHTLLVTRNRLYATAFLGFTPIGRMALDPFLLWVHAERDDIRSLDDFVAKVKEVGRDWKIGGTREGQDDSILTAMLEKELGIEMTYVPFPGGNEVAMNLVGKHIDSTFSNPAEQAEFYRDGYSKPLAQFTDERTEAFPDVPTARELGHEIIYYMQLSIVGPPGMTEEAQRWYIEVLGQVYESEEWQRHCEEAGLICDDWIAGEELGNFNRAHLELIDVSPLQCTNGQCDCGDGTCSNLCCSGGFPR